MRNAAQEPARFALVGGETMDGPRHIWWNFVSSRPERIEQAKAEWKAGRFDTVPGDAEEFIPLPDEMDCVIAFYEKPCCPPFGKLCGVGHSKGSDPIYA